MNRTVSSLFVLICLLAAAASAVPVNDPKEPAPKADPEFTWVGKLVDQACKERHIDQTCVVMPATERFGLVIDGGIIVPFDEASNQMIKETLAGRHKGNVEVTVVGARQQGIFKLESIQVNK